MKNHKEDYIYLIRLFQDPAYSHKNQNNAYFLIVSFLATS